MGNPANIPRTGRNSGHAVPWRTALVVIAVVMVSVFLLMILSVIAEILLLFFISILIAIALRGVSDKLSENSPLSERVALAVVVLIILALVIIGIVLLAPSVIEQVGQLIEQIPRSFQQLQTLLERDEIGQELLGPDAEIEDLVPDRGQLLMGFTDLVGSTLGLLATGVIVIFVGLYLSIEPRLYVNGFLRLIPAPQRARGREILGQIAHILRWWLLSRGVAMLAVGTLVTIGLSIIGLPLALGLGVVAGLFELIPYIGPFLGTVPAVLAALPTGAENTLYVLALFFVIQQAESYLITPFIERKAVHLPPALTVVSQVLLALLIGPLGIILAAPLTIVGITLVKMMYVEDVLHEPTDIEV